MRCVLSALAIWLGLGAVQADAAYPEKPIRIVVPYAAGGTADIFARFVAERLGTKWKHEFIVEVRPGAGGNIGSDYVAKAAPDGYTLLLGTSGSNAVNPTLYKTMPYTAEKDLVLVALVAETANILVVGANHPANSVKDLLDLARAKPGRVTFASSGNGSVLHLSGVLLAEKAGVKMLHVPYKGAAPALIDVLGGRVDMMIVNGPSAVGDITGKKLKGIAASTAKRVAALPDMPTMIESGIEGYDLSSWFGIFAPSGIPDAVRLKLNEAIREAIQEPATRERFQALGAEPVPMDADTARKFFLSELKKWGDLVRSSGATVD
jgi:tripartite-type tricarboxylate transporter receptor subunit TctC